MQKNRRDLFFYFGVPIGDSVIILATSKLICLKLRMPLRNTYLLLLLITSLIACRSTSTIEKVETSQYIMSDSANPKIDSALWKMVDPYRVQLSKTMSETLAISAQMLTKETPEGLLGNFAADACASVIKASGKYTVDFTVLNNGGLRTSLPSGSLILSNIFELMPFENELVILTLDGKTTGELLNYIAAKGGVPVSGIRMKINDKKVISAEIGENKYDSTATYNILTSDYLAGGGDNMNFLLSTKKKEITNIKVRDAMIQYLHDLSKKGEPLVVVKDGRIRNL
ncbi:5'-nucleotidase [soil metagenome]